MILCVLLLCLLSGGFFLLWQFVPRLWVPCLYVLSQLGVWALYALLQRRKNRRMVDRFARILQEGTGALLADEELTGPERQLVLRLCELEAREARVRDGYRQISSLVSDIAHQSKTPLSAILMYTELQPDCAVIRTQTEKLRFLLESLTKLAKCEGGLIAENLSPRENSVRELVRQAVESCFAAAEAKSMVLSCQVPAELTAFFDLRWTAEALGNILDNAVKYSPAGSTVTVTACPYDLFVRLDVTDQGSGIPPSDTGHIWKRFWRGKNASETEGVGIGLYLTACILSAQGSRASVQAAAGGSTFSVFLRKHE